MNSAEENKTHDAASSSPVDGKTAPSGDKRDTGDSSAHIFICQKNDSQPLPCRSPSLVIPSFNLKI